MSPPGAELVKVLLIKWILRYTRRNDAIASQGIWEIKRLTKKALLPARASRRQ